MSLFKRNKDSKKNTPNPTNYSSTPNNILVDNELKKENSNQTSLFNEKETIKKNLFSKPPETWTIYEVGSWLALLDFTEYRIPFVENNISGLELLDLTDQDLISLQINKLGDRKKLLKYIQLLKDGDSQKKISDDSSIDSEEKDLTDGTHSLSLDGEITIKCYYEDDVHMIDITNPSLSELEKKISEEFQLSEFVIKYKDNEDELITIQKDKDLIRALKNGKSNETPKLIIFKKSFLTESQIQTYNALADAVVIFDKKGYIQFLNINGEKLFEYSREKIIGKSFKLFLSEEDGKNFFSTLKKYRKLIQKDFGNVKIVSCKKSDGTIFFASLSINEIKETQNFIALFHLIEERELKKTEENKNYTNFNVLDGLSDATVVINDQGIIQFFNKEAENLFGFTKLETHGYSIGILMPEPFKSEHPKYISNYNKTRKGNVMGKERDVPVKCKNDLIIRCMLKLTEQEVDNKYFYIGTFKKTEENQTTSKSLLETERELLNSLLVPSLILDSNANIQAFNQPASQFFGFKMEEVMGENIKILLGNKENYVKNFLQVGKFNIEAIKKNGTTISFKIAVTQKEENKQKFFIIVIQS